MSIQLATSEVSPEVARAVRSAAPRRGPVGRGNVSPSLFRSVFSTTDKFKTF